MQTFREGQYTSTSGKAILADRSQHLRAAAGPDCLIVSAWGPELAELENSLPSLPLRVRRRVMLGTVGVGLVEAAVGASMLLATLLPKTVVLIGTAGLYPGAKGRLGVGAAAVARRIRLLSEAAACERAYLPPSMERTQESTPWLRASIRRAAGLASADVACPLAITATEAAAVIAATKSRSALENLEAFSVARAAASMKIPFAAVLGVANHVGPRGHREWKQNAAEAAAAACRAVADYLSRCAPKNLVTPFSPQRRRDG